MRYFKMISRIYILIVFLSICFLRDGAISKNCSWSLQYSFYQLCKNLHRQICRGGSQYTCHQRVKRCKPEYPISGRAGKTISNRCKRRIIDPRQQVLKKILLHLLNMMIMGTKKFRYSPYVSGTADGAFKNSPFSEQATFMNAQYGGQEKLFLWSDDL